jgi:membrane glycosyltransferase
VIDTPSSLPSPNDIRFRRLAIATLVVVLWGLILALAAACVRSDHWSLGWTLVLVCLAGQLPWGIIGLCNGFIGFAIAAFARNPLDLTAPHAAATAGDQPITASTAVLMCIRNEDTGAVFRRLDALAREIVATGAGPHFHLHILSDTSIETIGADELAATKQLQAVYGAALGGITYRRRTDNAGFKAGNIKAFCNRYADLYEYALVLDADSFMCGDKILSCVRMLQANPRIGILQCLTVGLPSVSPLARLFQFGMRLGMRSYTLGSAWWQADCGPYWGHNALIRLKLFAEHCDLPQLPGKPPFGGDILSHDQVEAVLMRRAGYEVRVIPVEGGSYEENPPTLPEFVRRDLRWCLGNLQYFALLGLKNIRPTSRVQLLLAIWMFLASAFDVLFWTGLLIQALADPKGSWINPGPALAMIGVFVILALAAKLASALTVLADARERRLWGGTGPFLTGFCLELVFSFLLTPIMHVSETAAMLVLLTGSTMPWNAQNRSEHAISWSAAARLFGPHTLLGVVIFALLWWVTPLAALLSLPVYGGLLVAIPLAVVTSSPDLGRWMARRHALAIPEDRFPPAEILALNLPACSLQRRRD